MTTPGKMMINRVINTALFQFETLLREACTLNHPNRVRLNIEHWRGPVRRVLYGVTKLATGTNEL